MCRFRPFVFSLRQSCVLRWLLLAGALLVRAPAAWLISRTEGVTLFRIGLATPMSTAVQIVMCLAMFVILDRREKGSLLNEAPPL